MRLRRAVFLPLVWFLAGAPALRAQAPEARKPELVLPASVEVVRLEVVVTDRRGHASAGLKREDFAVFEDGRPQPIVQFQAFARPAPGTPSVAGPVQLPRQVFSNFSGTLLTTVCAASARRMVRAWSLSQPV